MRGLASGDCLVWAGRVAVRKRVAARARGFMGFFSESLRGDITREHTPGAKAPVLLGGLRDPRLKPQATNLGVPRSKGFRTANAWGNGRVVTPIFGAMRLRRRWAPGRWCFESQTRAKANTGVSPLRCAPVEMTTSTAVQTAGYGVGGATSRRTTS